MLESFHSLHDYWVALFAYFLLWITWAFDRIVRIYTSYEANVFVNVSLSLSVVNWIAWGQAIAKLGGSWYVQNVSTFPNTFAIVSPLSCVFWMQLTRTNAVFSRIALVASFCAEIQLSGKFPENIAKSLFYPKTHGARRGRAGRPQGAHTHARRGSTPGRAWGGVTHLGTPLTSPSGYIRPLT